MLNFKDITIEDKTIFDRYFSIRKFENSEFSFTNIFIWRHQFQFKYTIINDLLCIIGAINKTQPILIAPIGTDFNNYPEVLAILEQYFEEKGHPLIIKSVTNHIKENMEILLPDKFIYEPDRNNYDYVYKSEDMIKLEGKKYRQKRNHINKFTRNYQYTYEPITKENIDECKQVEKEWLLQRGNTEELQIESIAICEALNNFDELGLKGGAIRIGGTIQAFTVGDLLNPDMAVIHFEKANTDYSGTYAMINKLFAENCWSNVTYINREEDMGIPGLRTAKLSYQPTKLIEKYTAYVK